MLTLYYTLQTFPHHFRRVPLAEFQDARVSVHLPIQCDVLTGHAFIYLLCNLYSMVLFFIIVAPFGAVGSKSYYVLYLVLRTF